jgi:hypothetical protein
VLAPSIARPAFDAGTVRRVPDDWSFPPMPVHAVMTSRPVPARVRVFVDFLASRLTVWTGPARDGVAEDCAVPRRSYGTIAGVRHRDFQRKSFG